MKLATDLRQQWLETQTGTTKKLPSQEPQHKKRHKRNNEAVSKYSTIAADKLLEMTNNKPVYFQKLPWFDFKQSFVNLLEYKYQMFDIVSCNVEKNINKINYAYYGIIININESDVTIYEMKVFDGIVFCPDLMKMTMSVTNLLALPQSFYTTISLGKYGTTTLSEFYNSYSENGCRILPNPYLRMLREIKTEELS